MKIKYVMYTSNFKFLLPLLLLAACTSTPKDDGTTPPSLYTPPKSWEANPKGGYKVNVVTGRAIEPITTVDGKTIPTGIPIPAIGKRINMDSIAKPQVLQVTPKVSAIKPMDNIYPIPESLQKITVDESQLIQHNATNSPQGYSIQNLLGGTTPTGKPFAAKGKTVLLFSPKINPALQLRINDNAKYDIQQLNIDQGLQQQWVGSLFQDKDGYLWIGTSGGGVSRYDGKSFVLYTTQNGLLNNDVRSIFQDSKGNFWFGHIRSGVSHFDGKTFTTYSKTEGLAGTFVWKIIEDKAGNIWMATNGGVNKFEPSKDNAGGNFINYTTNEGLSNNDVSSVLEDKSGNLWFTTSGGGVNKFDGKSFIHFTTKQGLANDTVNCIMEDRAGSLWFGTRRGVSKLEGNSFIHFPIQFSTANGLSDNDVTNIIEDKFGHIWFGTRRNGVFNYDGKQFINISEEEGLSFNFIPQNCILEDKSGQLWIGTAGAGLNKINTSIFQHYTKSEGLADNFVTTAYRDRKDKLWFNSITSIHKYDEAGQTNNIIQYPINYAFATYEDKEGNMWFGTIRGLIKYDGKSYYRFGTAEGISVPDVRSILQDSRGHLWFGGNGGGITRYEPATNGKPAAFFHYTEKEGFISRGTNTIVEDKKGNLWFTNGVGIGVTKYTPAKDGQSGTFVHYTAAEGLPSGVNNILEDKNGYLWFTTTNGLIRYEPSKQDHSGVFTHFASAQGLPTNTIGSSIFEDKSGVLWITSRYGLSKYDGKTFLNFTTAEGLSNNILSRVVEDKEGNLWIPTYGGGVNKMMKDAYKPSQQPPLVSLRQLYINEALPAYLNSSDSSIQKIKFDSVQLYENYPVNPKIPSGQNHLSFQYSALDWHAPTKIKYSFRLLGLDNKWSNPTAETKADYRNLPNGKFIFQVRAIGESGEWSKSFNYSFTILPPWWLTWWAYTIYALLFLIALRAFSLWREKKLRQEKVLLQEKVEERTVELKKKSEELEHSLEDLKSTQSQLIQSEKMASLGELTAGIAHEIQNPLNFVNNFSEVSTELIQELKVERLKVISERDEKLEEELLNDISTNMEKINHHGKRAGAIVSGMLQHSRTSTGVKEPTDINALADEYLRLAYHGLRAKDKTFNAKFETDFDEGIGKVNVISQDIGRVILNLITNAFYVVNERLRQAQPDAHYEPTVTVSTKKIGSKVEVRVKDNGNGIPQKILDKIFQPFFTTKPTGQGTGLGLSLSYDIVKAHGGELKVETKEGEGSEFVIVLPV
jgi:ligand-binding sensor domain-containing protein/signal transduction histidine kinase